MTLQQNRKMKINTIDFYEKYYSVSDPASKKSYRGNILDKNGEFGKLRRGDYQPENLVITYLEGGEEPNDLFWSHVNDPFCISERVKDLMIHNKITGIKFIPTIVKNRNKKQNPTQYYTALITGRVDKIDYLNSDIKFLKQDGWIKESAHFIGKRFDVESWDSSDFFMERADKEGKSTCFIYVSQKVVDLFKKNKISNILFERLSDYETWCDMIKIGESEVMKKKIDEKIKNASAQQAV
jgi:hypothetical protein